MATSNSRLATGVGVLSALVLFGAVGASAGAATAVADPGGRHSGHTADGNADTGKSKGDNGRSRGARGGPRGTGIDKSDRGGGSQRVAGSPTNGRGAQRVKPDADAGPECRTSRPSSPVRISGPDGGSEAGDAPAATAESGSGGANTPSVALRPPKVTAGNGRTPAPQTNEPSPPQRITPVAPAEQTPPPVVSPAIPLPPESWVDRIAESPAAAELMPGESGPLWGFAGLVLIPVAAVALGYRQARAAQAAAAVVPRG